jgi:primosomal protein N' (replication factor Y)
VGRNNTVNSVVAQTYQPKHPSIVFGLSKNYEGFYEYALEQRKLSKFPPFTHLLKLTTSYKTEASAIKAAKSLHLKLRKTLHSDVSILGPVPAFYERQYGNYRWQLILKSPRREYLLNIIDLIPANNWQYEIDPTSLL